MPRREYAGGYVEIFPTELNAVMRGRNGPVARELMEAGKIVKNGAIRRAGSDTGNLKARIVTRLVQDSAGGFAVIIVAEVPYALFHHEGTVPHIIEGRPFLAFEGAAGEVVIVRRVNHPGTRPNRFLVDALQDLKRRY